MLTTRIENLVVDLWHYTWPNEMGHLEIMQDKWKTLVHTARISPQQRRGEPVPQELLDRVLAAQAYWSHR